MPDGTELAVAAGSVPPGSRTTSSISSQSSDRGTCGSSIGCAKNNERNPIIHTAAVKSSQAGVRESEAGFTRIDISVEPSESFDVARLRMSQPSPSSPPGFSSLLRDSLAQRRQTTERIRSCPHYVPDGLPQWTNAEIKKRLPEENSRKPLGSEFRARQSWNRKQFFPTSGRCDYRTIPNKPARLLLLLA